MTVFRSGTFDAPAMKASPWRLLAALFCVAAVAGLAGPAGKSSAHAADAAAPRAPANQVFQWAFTGSCGEWPDGSQSTATSSLWIPEDCGRLRGLLILGTNPVRFYVESDPVVVEGDRLVLTRIPPRSAFPVRVTVAAWQWGRHSDPQVQTARILKRSFAIVKTAAGSP